MNFAAGEVAVDIPVTIATDATVEGNELQHHASGATGAVLSNKPFGHHRRRRRLADPPAASTYTFGEGGVSGIVVVTRSGNPGGTVGYRDGNRPDRQYTVDFTLTPTSGRLEFRPRRDRQDDHGQFS